MMFFSFIVMIFNTQEKNETELTVKHVCSVLLHVKMKHKHRFSCSLFHVFDSDISYSGCRVQAVEVLALNVE